MAYRHGKFVWRDNFTPDATAAKTWYSDLMGWDLEEFPMGDMGSYCMFKVGDIQLGGFMTMNDEMKAMGAPPHWLPYVSIDDVDAGAARAAGNGGKVLVPGTDIPTVGRFSVIMDPTGGVLALFKGLTEDPPVHPMPPPTGTIGGPSCAPTT